MAKSRVPFDNLRPRYPDARLHLESNDGDLSMRVVDIFAPIGKGTARNHRVSAARRENDSVQKIANSISQNHPKVTIIMLLIDERPEEVTEMIASTVRTEVISSTFDEGAARHVQVADMVLEKAKRLVESGKDVVILLDSLTRFARAHNAVRSAVGKNSFRWSRRCGIAQAETVFRQRPEN
jgi:transcription termination factor Rho